MPEFGSTEFWEAVGTITSAVLILITGFYAYLTFRMARAAETQAWEISKATVSARLKINQGALLLLEIENVGSSSASDLRVSLDRPLHKTHGSNDDLRDIPFFKNGMKSLPPRTPIAFSLGATHTWLNENQDREKHPSQFNVTLAYTTGGVQIDEVVPIDVVDQIYLSAVQRDYIDDFGRQFPERFSRSMDQLIGKVDSLADKSVPQIQSRKSWSGWFTQMRSYEKWSNKW